MLMMRGLCSHRMMHGLRGPRFTQRPADAHDARPLFTQNDARPLGRAAHDGPRFTQRPADADDARLPWAQVYKEAG